MLNGDGSTTPLVGQDDATETGYGSGLYQEHEISQSAWAFSRRNSSSRVRSRKLPKAGSRTTSSWRILDRNARFSQSSGQWSISRINRRYALYQADLYHTLVNMRMSKIVLLLSVLYVASICVFAFLFMFVDAECGLEAESFRAAYYFSLETLVTIGYGLPPAMQHAPYFNDCDSVLILITFESILGLLLDAFVVSLVFTRFGRAQTRATTIVFSDVACIKSSNGLQQLSFRVCEMRKHQLVEAHVRCYAIVRQGIEVTTIPMRLTHPDDELGSMMLLNVPFSVVHTIDQYSPLSISSNKVREPDTPILRHVDEVQGSRDLNKLPESSIPREFTEDEHRAYLLENRVEVVVLVEGIDALTSDTLQARHSYTVNDMAWNYRFEPCVSSGEDGIVIDFSRFHDVSPLVQ